MHDFRKMNLDDFAGIVASDAPTPGGGTLSAFCGVQAVALTTMVYSLTIDKKCYRDVPVQQKNEFVKRMEELPEISEQFFRFMDEDSAAFNCVMNAFRMPKSCEEEKFQRSCAIQDAYLQSAEVPLSVAKLAVTLYPYIRLAAEFGNPNAVSDAGVSALLAHTATEGAIMNVKINAAGMKHRDSANQLEEDANALLEESFRQKNHVTAIVYSKIAR